MSHLFRNPPKTGYYWLAFYQNHELHRESLKTKDKAAAKYLQNKKDRELIENSSVVPNQKRNCASLIKEYINFNEHRKTKSANLNSEEKINSFLEWANITTVDQINEKKLQDYLNHRINKENISLYTANHIIAILKAWLNYAVRMRYIFDNPLSRVKKYRLPENPKRFLSTNEIKNLLIAANNPDMYVDKKPTLYPVIAAGVYTGMRPAELFNLEWTDIDFTRNQITIRNKEGFTIKSKKFRIIPLHEHLKIILNPMRKTKGLCFDVTNRRRIFNRIIEEAKLSGIDLYTLRHTFISHAMMNGVPPSTVSKWAGHSSIVTTMGYSHLCPDHSTVEISKIEY